MKTTQMAAVLVGLGIVAWVTGYAQNNFELFDIPEEPPLPPPLDLPLMAKETLPESANYFSAAHPEWPPLPANFQADVPTVPVYSIALEMGQPAGAPFYLIDDREWYAAKELAKQEALALRLLTAAASGQSMMSSGLPEFPGEGEEGGGGEGGGGGSEYIPMVFTEEDLWLECVAVDFTNGTAELLIHNPIAMTNEAPVWFIWGAPWLNASIPWTWLGGTEPGQTNFTVPLLGEDQGYYRLAHPDADGNNDGLTDFWSWLHFGNVHASEAERTGPGDDYDLDAVSNADELAAGTDPNSISFVLSVTNRYVNTDPAAVFASISGGVPAQVAVLVDSTNFASALWTNYTSSNLPATLASDGWHDAWVALHGRAAGAVTNWQKIRVKRDTQPPTLEITSPAFETSLPLIQLQGRSAEDLSGITYTLGTVTNKRASVQNRHYDTNSFEFTTNTFQAYDLDLNPGTNVITLSATDRAGNVTVSNLVFTLTPDAIAPVLTMIWPTNNARLAGMNCTLRGWLDDPTAELTASVTGTNGVTNTVAGLVERDGKFWLQNVPLQAETNMVTLVAVDAWTNTTTTNLTLIRSGVVLTIDAVAESELWSGTVTVTGTISDASYSVWVNGLPATVNGNGTWIAYEVPLGSGGTASIGATAYPPGEEPSGPGGCGTGDGATDNPSSPNATSDEMEQDKPSRLFVESYSMARQGRLRVDQEFIYDLGGGPQLGVWHYEELGRAALGWQDDVGGAGASSLEEIYTSPLTNAATAVLAALAWPASRWPTLADGWEVVDYGSGLQTNQAGPAPVTMEYSDVYARREEFSWTMGQGEQPLAWRAVNEWTRTADAVVKLFTGGKSTAKKETLWELSGSAVEILDPWSVPPYGLIVPKRTVESERIRVGDYGLQSAEALLYVQAAKGETVDVTARVDDGPVQYTHNTTAVEPKPRIMYLATDVTGRTNASSIVDSRIMVGRRISLSLEWNPGLSQSGAVVSNLEWSVTGYAVSNYTANSSNAALVEDFTKTNTTVNFCWVTPGLKTVTCAFELHHAGKVIEESVSTFFDIASPSADFTLTVNGVIAADTNYLDGLGLPVASPNLHFGDNQSAGSAGVVFGYANANLKGYQEYYRFNFVQVGETHGRQCVGTNETRCRWSTNGLDTAYPYPDVLPPGLSGYFIQHPDGVAKDSPTMTLHSDAAEAFRGDQFVLYLMFEPGLGTGDSIPVPLQKLAWNWSATARQTNNVWELVSTNYPATASGTTTQEFPLWDYNIINSSWTTNQSNCQCP